MKRTKKIVTLALAAVLLVGTTVAATVAYLQDETEVVKNTFTVGNVEITLDEADVDVYGEKTSNPRDTANEYKLIPGHTYTKDPTIHVDAASEDCYLFVEVVNNLGDAEAETETNGYKDIEDQMAAKGWVKVSENGNVWYLASNGSIRKIDVAAEETLDFVVFDEFKILGTAVVGKTAEDGYTDGSIDLQDYATETNANNFITIQAYAIQADGFANSTPAQIWNSIAK